MKQFWIYLGCVIGVILLIVPPVNYLSDPAHVYEGEEYVENVLAGISKGYNVSNVGNFDERWFKKGLIELHKNDSVDYLIMGSSRVKLLSEDIKKFGKILNVGVSGVRLEDYLAFYQLAKNNNLKFKHVLIGIDPNVLNINYIDDRWKSISRYYYEFLGEEDTSDNNTLTKLKNLFSPTYFQSASRELAKSILHKKKGMEYVSTRENEEQTECIDGSMYYGVAMRERPQNEIDNAANNLHHSYKNYDTLSTKYEKELQMFIDSLKADNVEIVFYYAPYHPDYYKMIKKIKGFDLAVNYYKQFAERNGIRSFGTFNPDDLGFAKCDFYDGYHPKKEKADELFDKEF